MIQYILYSTFIWAVLLALYHFFLRRETFFRYNRIYLLIALISGLLMPLIPHFDIDTGPVAGIVLDPLIIGIKSIDAGGEIDILTKNTPVISLKNLILAVYIAGFVFALMRNTRFLLSIRRYRKEGMHIKSGEHNVIVLPYPLMTFSFFNTIYISEEDYRGDYKDKILMHESVHIRQKHSLDNIFIVLLKIVFWFNPVLILYEKYLKEIHEYEADKFVIRYIPKNSYGKLLITQLQSGMRYGFGNYFINSLLKKRIKMMYQKKTTGKWKYFTVFPILILLLVFVNSCKKDLDTNGIDKQYSDKMITPPPPPGNFKKGKMRQITYVDGEVVFYTVDEMPRFNGCEDIESLEDKMNCSTKKLFDYIYSHLQYPQEAKENNIEGKIVVRFIVNEEGKVQNVTILRDIGGGCGEAAKKAIESMNDLKQPWIPGVQNGKKVKVFFTMPIIFKLSDN